MRRRIAAMVAMVMMLGVMSVSPAFKSAAPALGKEGNNGTKVNVGPDKNQGGGNDAPKKAKKDHGGIL